MSRRKQRRTKRIFYPYGDLSEEAHYLGGELHGLLRRWHKNGKLASEERYRHGVLDGLCREWSSKGKLLGTYSMVRGTGTLRDWHDNGRLLTELAMLDGTFNGWSRAWLRDGTLISRRYHLDGKKVTQRAYDAARRREPRLIASPTDNPPLARKGRKLELLMHRLLVERMVGLPGRVGARKFLTGPPSRKDIIFFGRRKLTTPVTKLIEALHRAGAKSVIATDFYGKPRGPIVCDCLIVEWEAKASVRNQRFKEFGPTIAKLGLVHHHHPDSQTWLLMA